MLDHLEPWQQTFLVTYGVLAGLCFTTVACRVNVRAIRLKAFKLDDWIMVLAMTMNSFGLLCFTMAVRWGQGKAEFVWSIPVMQWNLGYQVLNIMTLSVAKLSIGFHLLRLTEGLYFRRSLWALIIFLFLLTIWAAMMPLLECVPMNAIWDISLRPPNGHAKCLSNKAYTSINLGIVSLIMATDIILALLPIPIVWRLPIRIQEKILLAIILGLGFFACFAGILKMYYAVHALEAGAYTTLMKFLVWQIVEPNIAIIAASLPTLRPLLRSFLSRLPSQPDSDPPHQPSSDISTIVGSSDKFPSSKDENLPGIDVGYRDSASVQQDFFHTETHR